MNTNFSKKVTFIETGISIQLPVGCGIYFTKIGLASKYSITSINSPDYPDIQVK